MHPLSTYVQRPPLQDSYRAEDIIAQYGNLVAFMAAVAPKKPLPIPNLHFTEEENRRMDQILAEERLPTDEGEVHED